MQVNVIITIQIDRNDETKHLAHELEKLGVRIENIFPFGVITGKVDESLIPLIKTYDFVESINLDRTVQLPPNNSDVQ